MPPIKRLQKPPNPHPSFKANWANLNEGQRRYAIEQWKLAHVRRGLPIPDQQRTPVVDNPVEPQPGTSTGVRHSVPPEVRHAPARLPASPEPSPFEWTPPHNPDEDGPEAFEIIHPPKRQRFNEHSSDSQDSLINLLSQVEDNPNDWGLHYSPDTDMSHPGTANSNQNKSPDAAPDSSQAMDTGDALSRPGSDGALGQPAGGAQVQRQWFTSNPQVWIFHKVHRFVSHAFCFSFIKYGGATSKVFAVSTPYAQIPWDRRFLYMSPGEEAMLPTTGVYVEEFSCKIIQRKVRIAFPTNSSTSELATLNQNSFTAHAIGLNKAMYGQNFLYTGMTDSTAMVPTGVNVVTTANYTANDEYLYGIANNSTLTTTVPGTNATGDVMSLSHYYCPVVPGPSTRSPAYTAPDIGLPNLQSHIHEHLSGETTDKQIVSVRYKPHCCYINQPLEHIYVNMGGVSLAGDAYARTAFPRDNEMVTRTRQVTNLSLDGTATVSALIPTVNSDTSTVPSQYLTRYVPMEQGPRSFPMFGTNTLKEIPSLHVGIKPIPKLNGALTTTTYTDAQAWWEVECTIVLKRDYPNYWTRAPRSNCSLNKKRFWTTGANATAINFNNEVMFGGLYQLPYPTTIPTIVPTNTTTYSTASMPQK